MGRDVIRDEEGDILEFDSTTGAIAVQSDIHKMSHQGLAWEVSHIFTGVLSSASVDMLVVVPSGYEFSGDPQVSSDQDITVEILKVASATPGTAITPNNLKSLSTNTPQSSFSYTPTGLGATTQVTGPRFFPASGVGQGASVFQKLTEIHLTGESGDALYLFRGTNNSLVASTINLSFLFYEEILSV